ncbi:MAG: hypothetical protein M3Z29_12700 [Pseudomonadota bacterium]|nr:hypothetical protein [Pseudomonadota bacterium]
MSDASGFNKLVPGFEFLQSLVKNAGVALPGIGQWVAPTLDPAELEKRIGELRTVQFWLEQNAKMLAATIQALEVQRMTLATLKTMNLQMGDLRESLTLKVPGAATGAAPSGAKTSTTDAASSAKRAAKPPGAAGVVDPMQWWSALTNQFTQLATTALKDTGGDAAKTMAGDMLKRSLDTATAGFNSAVTAPAKAAKALAGAALGTAAGADKRPAPPKAAKQRGTRTRR